jgi:hypothetical protein
MESYAARSDLADQPLDNPDLVLYTDGSLFVRDRIRHAAFTVISDFGIIQSGHLYPNTSTQLAELVDLTSELSKGRRVNIHTFPYMVS